MSVSKDLALSFAELHREISKCVIKASRLSCLPEVPVLVHRLGKQCCGSMIFWCGSGYDLDPRIHASD
jgi:hypothetical protein